MHDAAAFWQFSLALYAAPGVAPACLQLQDEWRANVNLMLWLVWLEQRGQLIDAPLLARAEAAIANWNQNTVQPLRALRRRLGVQLGAAGKKENKPEAQLYQQLKAAELLAEQIEQRILAKLVSTPAAALSMTKGVNLTQYLKRLNIPEAEQQRLLDCLDSEQYPAHFQ